MQHRPFNEKHEKKRRELYPRLIGYTDAYDERPAPVHEVEQKTGIRPPAWFNTAGTTLGAAERQAQLTRRGAK